MTRSSRTKQQHYVPRFYLERFAGTDGLLWAYDVSNGSAIAAKPKAVGAEGNFYSPLQADGSRFDDLELWLSRVESAAAPLFDSLSAGKLPRGEEREAMSLFLAAQYLRSPTMVSVFADMSGQIVHHMARTMVADEEAHKALLH